MIAGCWYRHIHRYTIIQEEIGNVGALGNTALPYLGPAGGVVEGPLSSSKMIISAVGGGGWVPC